MKLPLAPQDKANHFLYGSVITCISILAILYIDQKLFASNFLIWMGIVPAIAFGIFKEVWDSRGRGNVEAMDAVWTIFGGVPIWLCTLLAMKFYS
ncbi:hypothetical protein [Aureibacter tunicatorum]|uniref:Uncharacterized protein n=1 Tax=Aureibacter tunicatorum TaxID=866807 RepID=A0AAE3XRC0_9BACT|nr:hypothetical protein [Aureibacter tunicatorum]MDR6240019.1 hypothetical protein [Aureibacter tunicatorum]BDD04491.1 hypothetical protein AUTU_19740 [Aureibacter tunicatorum]